LNSKWSRNFKFFYLSCTLFVLSSCLYTTHHFNTGQLLEPGNTTVTLGAGLSHSADITCPDGYYGDVIRDSTRALKCIQSGSNIVLNGVPTQRSPTYIDPLSASNSFVNGSLSYRLGISGKAGFLTGLEMGMHIEGPTNPISGEFDLQMGLRAPKFLDYHSFSLGWSIGAWADNSYFIEYAASKLIYANPLFFNVRETYLATQRGDQDSSTTLKKFRSKRRWISQASIGWKWTLPTIVIVPDFIIPEIGITFPLAPTGTDPIPELFLHKMDWNLSFGFGWNFK